MVLSPPAAMFGGFLFSQKYFPPKNNIFLLIPQRKGILFFPIIRNNIFYLKDGWDTILKLNIYK